MTDEVHQEETWSSWIKNSSDKLVLLALFVFLALLTLHMVHDAKDADAILWAREMTGTVLGALLGLITGHALASSRATTIVRNGSSATVSSRGQG